MKSSGVAVLKTLLISPVLFLISVMCGIAQCFPGFLLPNALLCLLFAITANINPILFITAAFAATAVGIAYFIYILNEYAVNKHERFSQTAIYKTELIDRILLGLTLVTTGLLATTLPLTLFLDVSNIVRLGVCAVFILGFWTKTSIESYRLYREQLLSKLSKKGLNAVFLNTQSPSYTEMREQFIASYDAALEKLPERLQDRIRLENTQRDYNGAIYRELMFQPVKMEESQSNKPYEKTHLLRWLSQYQNIDPISKERITKPRLVELERLSNKIHQHREALIKLTQEKPAAELELLSEERLVASVYP